MKLTNEICISFLRGSGWLYNHDKEITISEHNKAIDDFVNNIKDELNCFEVKNLDTCVLFDFINSKAEQLKERNQNEQSI